jgi:NADPH:quinone reductase-like Zn-dependent oxidoreductase
MKAVLPESRSGADKPVVLGEAAEPEPADGELVAAVEAYSVNRRETFQLDGQIDRPLRESPTSLPAASRPDPTTGPPSR